MFLNFKMERTQLLCKNTDDGGRHGTYENRKVAWVLQRSVREYGNGVP